MPGSDDQDRSRGRGSLPPPSPGAEARRQLWRPGRADEAEADRLGTTQALLKPENPAVIEALGVSPAAPPEGRSLVAFVLVLVQQLYLGLQRLVEGVGAIQFALSREPQKPAWVGELEGVLERLERSVAERASAEFVRELRGDLRALRESVVAVKTDVDLLRQQMPAARVLQTLDERLQALEQALATGSTEAVGAGVAAMKAQLGRLEAAQTRSTAAPAVRWQQRLRWLAVRLPFALVGGVVIGCLLLVIPRFLPSDSNKVAQPAPQSDLATEIRALRDSNAALTAKVDGVIRCGHEECYKWWIEGEGANQVMKRDQCVWVIDPDCLAKPPPARAR